MDDGLPRTRTAMRTPESEWHHEFPADYPRDSVSSFTCQGRIPLLYHFLHTLVTPPVAFTTLPTGELIALISSRSDLKHSSYVLSPGVHPAIKVNRIAVAR